MKDHVQISRRSILDGVAKAAFSAVLGSASSLQRIWAFRPVALTEESEIAR